MLFSRVHTNCLHEVAQIQQKKASPQPRLFSRAALTVLTAGAIVPSWAGAGSVHGLTRATVLALALLGASIPVETTCTSCKRQAEMASGFARVCDSLTPCYTPEHSLAQDFDGCSEKKSVPCPRSSTSHPGTVTPSGRKRAVCKGLHTNPIRRVSGCS